MHPRNLQQASVRVRRSLCETRVFSKNYDAHNDNNAAKWKPNNEHLQSTVNYIEFLMNYDMNYAVVKWK
jgi:hypothetical protein